MWPTPLHPGVGQPCPGAVGGSLEPGTHTQTKQCKRLKVNKRRGRWLFLTIWVLQRVSRFLTPPDGVQVRAVGLHPVVVLWTPAIEMDLKRTRLLRCGAGDGEKNRRNGDSPWAGGLLCPRQWPLGSAWGSVYQRPPLSSPSGSHVEDAEEQAKEKFVWRQKWCDCMFVMVWKTNKLRSMLLCVVRTGLKALAGAAWVAVSSKYFSHEKLFGCLYSEEMEQKQVPPISHSQPFRLISLKSGTDWMWQRQIHSSLITMKLIVARIFFKQ